jgi:hypothetical protein
MSFVKKVLFITCLFSAEVFAQTPRVSSGTIKHYEKFESKFVVPRNADVWLPDVKVGTVYYVV